MSFIKKLRTLFLGKEVRGASALALSSVVAQAIVLVVTPVLSRLYEPEAFGYLTLVVSVTGMISPAIALRLESALMLPRENGVATALLVLGMTATVIISVLATITLQICFAFGWFSAMSQLPGFSLWVGGITLLSGIFILLGQFALRGRQYGAVAIRNITQGSTTAMAQLAFAIASSGPSGLIGGYFIGRMAGVIPLFTSVRAQLRRFESSDMRKVIREYRVFPLLFAPAALLNAGALAAPIIVTGIWFAVSDAGQFGMAERILAVPLVIVATAVGQVVEARLAFHFREKLGGSTSYYLRVSAILAGFSVGVAIVVWFGAPMLVPLILGNEWHAASMIMQMLIPMLVSRMIASPMSKAIVVIGWARTNLVLDIARALLIIGVLLACGRFETSLEEMVLWTSLAFALIYVVTWIVGLKGVNSLDARAYAK